MSKRRKAPPPPERTVHHPKYGDVPLVRWTRTYGDGSQQELLTYDPAYQPPLPPGAVRGDIRKQVYCCDFPHYYYQPIQRTCVQCRQPFTFGAAEQKFWYETMQFNFASTAIRCQPCRKQRRTDAALQAQLAQAVHAAATTPADPAALLALAEATAHYVERFEKGNLDRGLAAARRARKLRPDLVESLYWEGELQALAGRVAAAQEALTAYLTRRAKGTGRLATAAEKRLAELAA